MSPVWNASAIGGEYLSAASFLGIAGLILAYGADMLWFPVGYTAGYLVLLVLVAAPLRRSGAYTLPDFAEARTESRTVRRIASVLVVTIGWLYLLPQLVGAGLTVSLTTGAPSWVGGLLVAVVVVFSVATGGMRSITFVQAFQYWLKLTALAVPVVFLLLAWQADGSPSPADGPATFSGAHHRAGRRRSPRSWCVTPVVVRVDGVIGTVGDESTPTTYDGQPVTLEPGTWRVAADTSLTFPAGAAVPHTQLARAQRRQRLVPAAVRQRRPRPPALRDVLADPRAVLRDDGAAARAGALLHQPRRPGRPAYDARRALPARRLLPAADDLRRARPGLHTGPAAHRRTDTAVLLLPERLVGGTAGQLLTALVTAGAFAAFLSTSSGLTVSVAGVLSQDVLRGSVRDFRLAAALAVSVPFLLSLGASSLAVADVVGLAFAVAASSFCPLLLLGIWWRGLTDVGAIAGLLAGGGLATLAVSATIAGVDRGGWAGALLAQPAAWTVPTAFAVMVLVSLRDAGPHRTRDRPDDGAAARAGGGRSWPTMPRPGRPA